MWNNFKFHCNLTRITGTSREVLCMFKVYRWILPKMRKYQKYVLEKININILCSITCFRKSSHWWNNVEKYCKTGQATDCNMRQRMWFECWMTKATDTHTHTHTCTYTHPQYVMNTVVLQRLRERASISRYTCITCLVNSDVPLLQCCSSFWFPTGFRQTHVALDADAPLTLPHIHCKNRRFNRHFCRKNCCFMNSLQYTYQYPAPIKNSSASYNQSRRNFI
jgi:hypothetical protein